MLKRHGHTHMHIHTEYKELKHRFALEQYYKFRNNTSIEKFHLDRNKQIHQQISKSYKKK